MNKRTIPQAVRDIAKEYYTYSPKWIKEIDGVSYYDEDIPSLYGNLPDPTGLPCFIAFDGFKASVLEGEKALATIELLFPEN